MVVEVKYSMLVSNKFYHLAITLSSKLETFLNFPLGLRGTPSFRLVGSHYYW